MSALTGAVLIIAPPTWHQPRLLLTLQQVGPALALFFTTDAGHALTLLHQQLFRLVVLDTLLTDAALPELLVQLAHPRQAVLLLTDFPQRRPGPPHTGQLARHAPAQEVLAAVQALLAESSADPVAVIQPAPTTPFSSRELEVLRLAANDCCNQEIARQLCLSVRTVESHRRALLQKAGSKTLTGLAVQAVRQGWIALNLILLGCLSC